MADPTPNPVLRIAASGGGARVLVIDDDPIVADSLVEFLRSEGYDPASASSGLEAMELLRDGEATPGGPNKPDRAFSVAICDVSLPGKNGLEVLRDVVRDHPGTAVVMLTGYGTIESAVEALRRGAVDYLTKPVIDSELRVAFERALQQSALKRENLSLHRQLDERFGLDSIIGADPRMREIYTLVEAVAASRTTVLMTGESGTGKSLIAHAIHRRSPRREKPFVEISCGSIPETLLESELFGHVKGAFTGAHVDKTGRFLAADKGTIFLDEINSASPAMQLKLLRVLQERKFEPVGSSQTVEVDVRVVLASNQPLEQLVAQGSFRQDLYYRINVVKIEVPPLRDRISDISRLAGHFLERFGKELGKQLVGFTPEAMELIRRYPYPGNVRELQNVIERAAVLARTPTIGVSELPPHVTGEDTSGRLALAARNAAEDETPWVPVALEEALKDPEKRILVRALKANDWNRQKTAEQLGINRTTLYKKMKAYGLMDGEEAA
jgi:DNA-binding NtrC family response regulator